MKTALIIGGGLAVYYLWSRGYIAQLFNGTPNGAPTVVAAGGAGVGMTAGGQAATVYSAVGRQLGATVRAVSLAIPTRAPYPITAPTPVNPFVSAAKAAIAAGAMTPQSPADGAPPNRVLVPFVRGTAAATQVS